MGPFGAAVAQWVAFYGLAGGASATLAGLLFLSVSLHIELIVDENFPDAQALAKQTFYTFLYVVVISLVILVPGQTTSGVGIPLSIVAVFALLQEVGIVSQTLRLRHGIPQGLQRAIFLLRRVVTPVICYLALLISADPILNGDANALYVLVEVIIMLLANATGNSWSLLLRLAQAKRAIAAGKQAPADKPTK